MNAALKRRLETFGPYIIAREVRRSLTEALARLRSPTNTLIRLAPPHPSGESALLAYRLEPFVLPRERQPTWHTQYWVTEQIARTLLDLGYQVDAVYQNNERYWPRTPYSVVIDVRRVLERLAPVLPSRCVKIFHIDTAHLAFHNAAESRRLLALQRRRGITIPSSRFTPPNLGIEHADCATTYGTEFTMSTFRYAGKPIYPVPIASPITCPWPDGKDFDAARRRFLFFSSHGLVHKGLDLVLEAFARMPHLRLTICGPLDDEPAFVDAYRTELYETPNIEAIGWIDTTSRQFVQIANECVAVVQPSCSEGGPAATVEAMHAGLIPIVTVESSIDVGDFGVLIADATVEAVAAAVSRVAALDPAEVRQRARGAWEHARARHTRERFVVEYRRTLETILATFGAPAVAAGAVRS
jgi:glycosyltransferase involved in cell wall biosynthesis